MVDYGKTKDNEMTVLDHLSPSSISTYLDSPLRWKNHYIDGIKDGYNPSLHRGSVAHKILEEYFLKVMAGEPPVLEAFLDDAVPRVWDTLKKENGGTFDDDLVVRSSLRQLLANYLGGVGQQLKPLSVEAPFSFKIPGKQLIKMVGRIDLIAEVADTTWVIDFKTSARKRAPSEVEKDVQATVYAIALNKLTDTPKDVMFSYHQLIFKKEPEVALLNRCITVAEQNEFEHGFIPAFVHTLEWQIETGNFFPNPNARFGQGT